MKRDMELIRRMMLQIRGRHTDNLGDLEMDGVDFAIVARHFELLHQEGFVKGLIHRSSSTGEIDRILVKDLTMAGHDFIDALGNDGVWSKIKEMYSPAQLSTLPFKVIYNAGIAILTELVKSAVRG